MKIGVIGSRSLRVDNIGDYLPKNCTEIISGGARGVDSCAAEHSKNNKIILTELLPDYKRYGRAAPLVRNKKVVESSDMIIAFWDGRSKGTKYVIDYAKKINKPCNVIMLEQDIT